METLVSHRVGGNRKRSKQSTNADQKSIETVFSIVICRLLGDKMAIENSVSNEFLSTFLDSICVFDCRLSGVVSSSQTQYQKILTKLQNVPHGSKNESLFTFTTKLI